MVCLILTELTEERGTEFADAVLKAVHEMLPAEVATNKDLTLEHLVGMQSGLRDYWALTLLWGATPQDRFSIYHDAPRASKRLGGFHFEPGTQMSYCNTNFMVVGLAIEQVTGQTLTDLLEERVFKPAGMKTALLGPDTARIPPPLVGYEGSEEIGYIPYANRIEWAGDAGVHASLDDMIAYEKYVHRSSKDENSAYYKNSRDPKYKDGEPAGYGHGLFHYGEIGGAKMIGHSGGLPGFRLRRVFVPTQRLSVIVLLNCEFDTKLIADHVLKKLITAESSTDQSPTVDGEPAESKIDVKWAGNYFDEDAKIAVVVKQDKQGELVVNYSGHDDKIKVHSENEAKSKEMVVRVVDNGLSIDRLSEHRSFVARPLAVTKADLDTTALLGKYYSEETNSTFHVSGGGGMLYGSFDGYLGKGPIHLMRWLGEGVWWLACFRSLDNPTPGYWTIAFQKTKDQGSVSGVTVGCWLARGVQFQKIK